MPRTPAMRYLLLILITTFTSPLFAERIFESKVPVKLLDEGANEGPAWHPQLGVLSSGKGGVHLMMTSKFKLMFLPDAGTNGLLFDHQGRLLICQPKFRRVSRVDVKTKKIEVLTDSFQGKKYNQPNDITVDTLGNIYFTDPKYGSRDGIEQLDAEGRAIEGVYLIQAGDGSVERVITHEVDRPNGIMVSPDDKHLFVAGNNNNKAGGERKLFRFDLAPDRTVKLDSKLELFDWKTGRGPDGLAMDVEGRLYVAGGLNKPHPPFETANEFKGGVYVLSPKGELLDFIAIPRDEVTNCTFGGNDHRTLYITAGGSLWSIKTTTPGVVPKFIAKAS